MFTASFCWTSVPSPTGEEVMSEVREVLSFIGWNFFQLKCIINLGNWSKTVSQVMPVCFFTTTMVSYSILFYYSFFTALHGMQTRSSDENSVCLSVCLPVRMSVTCVDCDKTVERSVQIYISYERTFSLVFRPLLPEILGQPDPVGAKSPILNR